MYGVRLRWSELPGQVRDWVGEVLGAPVVEARSQPGGISPGTADRVVTADGGRAFVKAVSDRQNPDSPALHRREAEVLRTLAATEVGVPRLLGVLDDDGWVALVVEDVEGRHPGRPWTHAQLGAALQTLGAVSGLSAPRDWPGLEGELAAEMACWARVAEDVPDDLDPWLAARLEDLHALCERTLPRLAGGSVAHTDVRADNLLVEPGGAVRLVDWPWACRGAAWADAAMLLVDVRRDGGLDVRPHVPALHALGARDEDVLGLVAGLTGFCTHASRRPPAPGLPTLRRFQAEQARAGTRLLQELGLP